MALFVVRHQHAADRCPARDPDLGALLLNHLSRPNVRRSGLEIKGEAVVRGEHTLYLIVDAPDEATLAPFLAPFALAGDVDIYPAATCAGVVAGGGCDAGPPPIDGVPALDPAEAVQRAIDAGLVVHRAHPLNGETSIPALLGGVVMPNAHFYVRNHFQLPVLDPATWRLHVAGLVDRPLRLGLPELMRLPTRSRVVTLECAGNGRALLTPPTPGEPWRLGAVSTAEWTGVPLVEVLDRAGVAATAREIVFRGADRGTPPGARAPAPFARSLALDLARDPDVLLAYAMNGEPLPVQHGFPLRLIVPSWYAMASVKWLTAIDAIAAPFDGYYQTQSYYLEREANGRVEREPMTLQRVRALITEPGADAVVAAGPAAIRGVAWSGAAPIARVDVGVGDRWEAARLLGERTRHHWQWWELLTRLEPSGPLILRARATDLAGRTQPEHAEWNRLGYGNNAIQAVPIRVT
jgi:DMSO/TMAO reductase YedYZ molybdopterin-dependent catalytic subunit